MAPKGQYNSFGKYKYRSAEDILEAIKPVAQEHKVTFQITEVVEEVAGRAAVVSCAIIRDQETDNLIESYAHAFIDWDAKGMQVPQRSGSASSYAKKYALGNLLLIDDTKDPDATNDHGRGKAPSKAAPKKAAAAKSTKPILKEDTEPYKKVVEALSSGNFTLAQVEKKYQISAELKSKLEKL